MRGQRTHLIETLIKTAHERGGWCKVGTTRSLTVTAEVVIALCDYYAQAPSVPSPSESILLAQIDGVLVAAQESIVTIVKQRNADGTGFDPPNCALALAAYLTLRSHQTEKGLPLGPADRDFVGICVKKAIDTGNWLEDKPGATWACIKAFEIIWRYTHEGSDTDANSALDSFNIDRLSERLQTQLIRIFNSKFLEDGQVYSASVCLDLSFSVAGWASSVTQKELDAARQKCLLALRSRFSDAAAIKSLALNDFYSGSGEDISYQVVAPAALLTGVDQLLKMPSQANSEKDFWQPVLYSVAEEMDKASELTSEPAYVIAHHLRALTASELAPREVSVIRQLFIERAKMQEREKYLQSPINDQLGALLARYGNPGEKAFFAASNIVFVIFTLILYGLSLITLFSATIGSAGWISSAITGAVVLTPLSLVIWARKERLHEKPPAERALSIFQFFVIGGWIAIPIFIAFVANWFKNITVAHFGH